MNIFFFLEWKPVESCHCKLLYGIIGPTDFLVFSTCNWFKWKSLFSIFELKSVCKSMILWCAKHQKHKFFILRSNIMSNWNCLSVIYDRNWSMWTFGLLWNLKKFGHLPFNKATWRKCLCCEELHNLARNLLSYTTYWSNPSRFVLGKVQDNCCFLHYLLSCKTHMCIYLKKLVVVP